MNNSRDHQLIPLLLFIFYLIILNPLTFLIFFSFSFPNSLNSRMPFKVRPCNEPGILALAEFKSELEPSFKLL